jgi:hypothetical protein
MPLTTKTNYATIKKQSIKKCIMKVQSKVIIISFSFGFFSAITISLLASRIEVATLVFLKLWEYNWPVMLAVGILLIASLSFVIFFPIWLKKKKIANTKAKEVQLIVDSVSSVPDADEIDRIIASYIERGGDSVSLPDFESPRPSGLAGDIATREALQQMNISIKKS